MKLSFPKQQLASAMLGALLLSAGLAQAATVTSPAGMTFTVTGGCSITGHSPNIGAFTTGQTYNDYGVNQGFQRSNGGQQGSNFITMATVNCPVGTAWTVNWADTSEQSHYLPVKDPSNNTAFTVVPFVIYSDNAAGTVANQYARATDPGVTGTGTGAAQDLVGTYRLGTFFATNEAAFLATPFVAGTYTLASTVVLTF